MAPVIPEVDTSLCARFDPPQNFGPMNKDLLSLSVFISPIRSQILCCTEQLKPSDIERHYILNHVRVVSLRVLYRPADRISSNILSTKRISLDT